MHRTKTHFARRLNRIGTALERRGVMATYELHDRLLANTSARRCFSHHTPVLDDVQQRIVEELRAEGYSALSFSELFPDPGDWWDVETRPPGGSSRKSRTALRARREGSQRPRSGGGWGRSS